jgi:Icc-related predicted phosphoesterase
MEFKKSNSIENAAQKKVVEQIIIGGGLKTKPILFKKKYTMPIFPF